MTGPASLASFRSHSAKVKPSMPGSRASARIRRKFRPWLAALWTFVKAVGTSSAISGFIDHRRNVSTRMRPLVGFSATTSTGRPRRASRLTAGSPGSSSSPACRPNRAVKRKMLPLPGSLSTQIRPPMRSTRRRVMVSPKPVPPYCRVVEASACVKGAKIRSWSSGAMPMPVSATANSKHDLVRFFRLHSRARRSPPPWK